MKKILYTLSGFAMLAVSSVALVPSEAEAIPLPSDDTTPPVTNTYLVINSENKRRRYFEGL